MHTLRLVVLLSLLTEASGAHAQQTRQELDVERLAKVKAAYVLNFIRFTQWPAKRFDDGPPVDETQPAGEAQRARELAPIVLGMLGRSWDHFDMYLEQLVRHETVQGRPIRFQRLHWPEPEPGETEVDPERMEQFRQSLRELHALVITRSERYRLSSALEILEQGEVLTISDMPRFVERGGMLGMRVRERRVQIEANVSTIEQSGVSISSRLLRHARIVRTPETQ